MKYMKISLIFIVALLLISGFSVIYAAAPSLSNAGGGSWSNYREITITNSGNALTDYQVLVQLSGNSFPTTSSNGADIRFTDAIGNELSYWIESWDYAGKTGGIWVKVPNVPPSGNTIIKMYYGNTNAGGVSNGETTFEFFDDFVGTNLNINKWYTSNGTYSVSNGVLTITTGAIGLQNALPFDLRNGYVFEGKINYGAVNTLYSGTIEVSSSRFTQPFNSGSDATILYQRNLNSKTVLTGIGSGASAANPKLAPYNYDITFDTVIFNSADTTWYILGDEVTPSTAGLWKDYSKLQSYSVNWAKAIRYISLGSFYGDASYDIQDTSYDWVRIRKYTSSEPTLTFGAEQPVPTPLITGNISITSSPTGAEVLVDGASKGTAPLTIPNLPSGSHAVKCKLSGYSDYDTSAPVTAGSTSSVICSLAKEGELSVKLSTEPASIQPGQISTIKITVTKDEAPVSGVTVMLSSTPGVNFSSSSGTTTNGEFISTFTTSTEGEIKISALAKKEGITDGKGETVVQVEKITPTPRTPTGKQAEITGKVIDAGTDDPVQDVTISVDGKSAVTGSNGDYELSVDVGKHNLSASKSGYKAMTRSVIVPDGGTVLDLSLKPASGDTSWFWIVIILILVVAAAGIIYFFYRKKKLKEKEQMEEKAKREKEAKEREEKEKREKEERERKEKEEKKRKTKEKKSLCMYCHAPLSLGSKFCNECGKKQEEKTRFCMNCGAPMPNAPDSCPECGKFPPSDVDTKTCKNCGEVIPIVAQFCSACGAKQPG